MGIKSKDRTAIYCDCHGSPGGVVMGYREGDRIIWYDRRHGERHVKVLDAAALTTEAKPVT